MCAAGKKYRVTALGRMHDSFCTRDDNFKVQREFKNPTNESDQGIIKDRYGGDLFRPVATQTVGKT